jgi:hypothetical protein
MVRLFSVFVVAPLLPGAAIALAADAPQILSQKIAGLERKDGLSPLN